MSFDDTISSGIFGDFGGQYVPEILIPALLQLELAYLDNKDNKDFITELHSLYKDFGGRPTPLFFAKNLSNELGYKLYIKREDLLHGGAHKLNNTLGQALLARKMSKSRLIAETGAGQHGIAVAMAGALMGFKTEIFMGINDIKRQSHNAHIIKLLGAKINPVEGSGGVLKDAINEALRDWVTNLKTTHYLVGSAVGPHPFPTIVRDFQSIIGNEVKVQIMEKEKRIPNAIIACGGGGSNALGIFYPFLNEDIDLFFIEAGGKNLSNDEHAAALTKGRKGILHGTLTYVLQDKFGQIKKTSSIGAGLNYPARGPEISYLRDAGKINAYYSSDEEAMFGFKKMSELEGIIPALETAHAIAHLYKLRGCYNYDDIVLLNLSGRGDKDIETAIKHFR